ncbi:uncharacterized protein LOC125137304 [Phacochoerus africanus]|uniref:uncharacterized protein LOC125137304 n=1 Tax=Phacochoerus africanus TaxID=41426 RepID=UPI001FD944B3|nr:uncharacterized protein LOC125137304 [Phacochoerus africanus]
MAGVDSDQAVVGPRQVRACGEGRQRLQQCQLQAGCAGSGEGHAASHWRPWRPRDPEARWSRPLRALRETRERGTGRRDVQREGCVALWAAVLLCQPEAHWPELPGRWNCYNPSRGPGRGLSQGRSPWASSRRCLLWSVPARAWPGRCWEGGSREGPGKRLPPRSGMPQPHVPKKARQPPLHMVVYAGGLGCLSWKADVPGRGVPHPHRQKGQAAAGERGHLRGQVPVWLGGGQGWMQGQEAWPWAGELHCLGAGSGCPPWLLCCTQLEQGRASPAVRSPGPLPRLGLSRCDTPQLGPGVQAGGGGRVADD